MAVLSELRDGAKELADLSDSAFVSPARWNLWCNQGLKRLFALVATANPDHFFDEVDFTLTASVTGARFTLPLNFSWLRGVTRRPGTGDRVSVRPFNFSERDDVQGSVSLRRWCPRVRYRLMGGVLLMEPFEQCADIYRAYIVKKPLPMGDALSYACTNISGGQLDVASGALTEAYRGGQCRIVNSDLNDGDYTIVTVDNPDSATLSPTPVNEADMTEATAYFSPRRTIVGPPDTLELWSEFIEVFAALKAQGKEESDTGDLGTQLMMLRQDIEVAMSTRDMGEPEKVAEIEGGGGGGFTGAW